MVEEQQVNPTEPEAGFTLVEALVAILMLMIGLAAIASLFVVGGRSNTLASHTTAATLVAGQIMDELKAKQFGELTLGGNLDSDGAGFFRNDDMAGVGRIHSRWQITQMDSQVYFIRVRSESTGAMARQASRVEFTAVRTCAAQSKGCPVGP